ncbi:MAG: OmpP1/FadL family transporter, partial [Myxococcales bacterium]
MIRRLLLALLCALVPGVAQAGGFAVSEQDAAASGRAGTAIARGSSASAVHYNPAALAGIEGAALAAGGDLVMPSATAALPDGSAPERSRIAISAPPHLYGAWGNEAFALGAGVNVPFGGGLTYDEAWRGRFELTRMSLRVFGGHLAAAWRASPDLSFGASVSVYRASVELQKKRDFVDREGGIHLGGSGTGLGAGLGIHWNTPWAPLKERVKLGLTGRLPSPLELKGRVHFSDVPPAVGNLLQDQDITARLTLPARIGFGMELPMRFEELPIRRLDLFFDAELTFWNSFRSFEVAFANPELNVTEPRDWGPAPTFRLGAETAYANTTLRAGLLFDGRASPASTLSP